MRGLQRRDDPLQPRELGEGGQRLRVGDRDVAWRGRCRAGGRARGRRPGSRARPRPSAPRGSGPPRRRSPRRASRAGRRCGRRPARRRGGRVSSPSPAASTPISSTSASSMNGVKMPIELEPPPTQAITRAGSAALGGQRLLARLVADHPLQVADQRREGRRADRRADHVVGRLDVGDPVADRGADRLLQGPRAGLDRRPPRRRAAPSARRWAPGGGCPRCPCRRRTRGRAARRRSRSRRRAGRRRSRRSPAACPSAGRAAPGRSRC